MKKLRIAVTIVLIITVLSACGSSKESENDIKGEWQAYGTKTEDGIKSYDELFDSKTAKTMCSGKLSFSEDGKVTSENSSTSLEGTYEGNGDGYVMTFIINEPDTEQQMKAYIENGRLIVEQIVPDGHEDSDLGDPAVYEKTK